MSILLSFGGQVTKDGLYGRFLKFIGWMGKHGVYVEALQIHEKKRRHFLVLTLFNKALVILQRTPWSLVIVLLV
jgi:hypothetical protein